jgi:hypothetical protein
MKNQPNTPLVAAMGSNSLKQTYKTPVLQRFGLVTDLTNNNVGSCSNDGNAACKTSDSAMARM